MHFSHPTLASESDHVVVLVEITRVGSDFSLVDIDITTLTCLLPFISKIGPLGPVYTTVEKSTSHENKGVS